MDPSIVCSDECIGLAHVRNSARLGVQSQTLFIYRNKNIAMCVSRLILFMKKKKGIIQSGQISTTPRFKIQSRTCYQSTEGIKKK